MKAEGIFSKKKRTNFLGLLWKTIRRFISDEAMNHSAALAYYDRLCSPRYPDHLNFS